jgi:transcriptional regulator with XRE-family HTH domain
MKPPRRVDMPRYSWAIRHLRERRSLTQSELAVEARVRTNTVARWESGVREPDFWSYWSLHALAYLWQEWDLAEFFEGRMEMAEAKSKWDRRHLLRNLASVRARVAEGDEEAARLLADSEKDRDAYLREKVARIHSLHPECRDFPDQLNDQHKYGLTDEQWSALQQAYMSKHQGAILQEIREVEVTDLLREGREWEAIAREEDELKTRQREQQQKARDLRKRFESFRKQRERAKRIVRAVLHSELEATPEEHDLARDANIAEILGVDAKERER